MADNVNITRSLITEQGDSADRAALPDHNSKPRKTGPRVSAQGQLTILLASLLALALAAAWLYQQWLILELDQPFVAGSVRIFVLVVLPISGMYGALNWLYARGQQARIVRLENDHPVSVEMALAGQLALPSLASYYQTQAAWANNSGLRSLNQLDMSQTKAPEPKAPAQLAAETPLALVPDSDWLGWIDQTPHVMIAGRTAAGKTTLATAILNQRHNELICVLDPHNQPGKWLGNSAIGGGRDYDAIMDALAGILAEMDTRYIEYNAGRQLFDRITTVIDEVPAIVLRDKAQWAKFASQLGSEARKVMMSMMLLTQSPLVRDIEISSVMRENFTRIALGDQASVLIRDEPDSKRKAQLLELLRGQEYPAAMEYRNEVHLLDTSNVPMLAKQSHKARLWTPPQIARPDSQYDLTMKAIKSAKEKGWTRDMARRAGLKFDNNMWGVESE